MNLFDDVVPMFKFPSYKKEVIIFYILLRATFYLHPEKDNFSYFILIYS